MSYSDTTLTTKGVILLTLYSGVIFRTNSASSQCHQCLVVVVVVEPFPLMCCDLLLIGRCVVMMHSQYTLKVGFSEFMAYCVNRNIL